MACSFIIWGCHSSFNMTLRKCHILNRRSLIFLCFDESCDRNVSHVRIPVHHTDMRLIQMIYPSRKTKLDFRAFSCSCTLSNNKFTTTADLSVWVQDHITQMCPIGSSILLCIADSVQSVAPSHLCHCPELQLVSFKATQGKLAQHRNPVTWKGRRCLRKNIFYIKCRHFRSLSFCNIITRCKSDAERMQPVTAQRKPLSTVQHIRCCHFIS